MRMVFYRNDENNPLTLGLLCCSTSRLHVPVPSFLFRDIWPLISLREKEESVSVTNSINHFPLSSFLMYSCREPGNCCCPLSSAARDPRNLARDSRNLVQNRPVLRCNAHPRARFLSAAPECVMESRRYIGENCWGGRHHCSDS